MNTTAPSKSQLRRRKRDQKKSQRTLLQKFIRAIGGILVTVIILLAILVGIGRAYIDANPNIKDELTQKLAQRLGIGLVAKDIGVRWRWAGPEVTIDSLEFQHPQTKKTFVTFERAQVVLDIKRYLQTRVLGVSGVKLQGSSLVLQRREGNSLYFNGIELSQLQDIFSGQKNAEDNEEAITPKTNITYPKGIFELEAINFVYQDALTKKEIKIDDISTVIDNNEQLLKLLISAEADEFADKLKVTLSTPNPELHKNLSWRIVVEADNLDLAELNSQWVNLKPLLFSQSTPQMQASTDKLKFSRGSSDIKMFMSYADKRIKAMDGTVDFNNIKLQRSIAQDTQRLTGLEFRFSYEHDNDLLNFLIDKIKVDGTQSNWPENNAIQFKRLMTSNLNSQSITHIQRELQNEVSQERQVLEQISENEVETLIEIDRSTTTLAVKESESNSPFKNIKLAELKVDYINLSELSPLFEVFTGFVPASKQLDGLDWQDVEGVLKDIHIELDNPNNKEYSFGDLSAALEFENFSIPSINDSSSISGLTGVFDYANKQGTLNINSKSVVYQNAKLFRDKIKLDTAYSNIIIQNEIDTWQLTSESVELKNQDLLFNSNLDISFAKDSSPIANIEAQIKPKNLDRVKPYLPSKIMDDKVIDWLEDRVKGGEVDTINLVLKGALKDFPFRNKQGEFLTEFRVKNLDMNYADGWPAVRLLNADVQFKNETATLNASQAKTGDLASVPLTAAFKDIAKSPLTLGIDTSIDLQAVKIWINNSPLRDSVGEVLKTVDVAGQAQSKIDISLPLAKVEDISVNGQIDFTNNDMKLETFDETFTNLTGRLNFTKDEFYSDKLNAIFQGQEIQASLKPQGEDTLINLHTEAQLGSFLGEYFSNYITGNSTVNAEVTISGQKGVGVNNIKLRSNLLGSGLVLPAPFDKAEDTLMPLNLNIDVLQFSQPSQRQQMRLSGNAGNKLLRARFDSTVDNPDSDWSLRSLAIVGGEDESLFDSINPEQARINVFGNFSHVDFDEWLDFLNNESNAQTDDALEIGTVSVNLKKLDAIGQSFPDTQVLLVPGLSEWNATINNTQVIGNIKFPRPWLNDSLIEANLEKYHLILPEGGTEEIDFDPREIPNVSITVKDFQLATMPMGQTSLRIKKESNGARIESFKINNSNFDIDGSGGWFRTTEGETSLVSIELNSTDLENTLKQLGYAPAASAMSAVALIELDWPGSPFTDILQKVSGSISFKLLNGDIREVEPGAGRFLALLSIAQLPKRLSLDFRDVFNSGLHYDELSADFTVHQGQAYTNNMLMRGPVADLGVVGRVGLATRDFEQAAVVQADLGSSLPIAGVIAGGLGVGAALLIFSEIFKNPLKQATQVFYKIDGEWSNPKIERALPQDLEEIPIAPR